jgi:peptidoglycan/LPS O-acetylase OafA/YrhL
MEVTQRPGIDLAPTPPLDGLRGVAIVAVLATHISFLDDGAYRFALRGGYLGVDVFVVLSAFLIGSVLLRSLSTDRFSTGDFARRRLRRLWPALLVFLVVESIVALGFGESVLRQAGQVLWATTFTFNWQWLASSSPPFALAHLWSLALEAQFYVLMAFGLVLGRRWLNRPVAVAAALGGLALLVALWRAWLFHRGVPIAELYVRTDTRADSMALGLAAAVLWRAGLLSRRTLTAVSVPAVVFLAGCLVFVGVESSWLYRGGFTLVAIAAAVVVATVATSDTWGNNVLSGRPLRWIGARSYSLYLWHLPIYIWFVEVVPDAPVLLTAPLAIAASVGVAMVSFRWIEARSLAVWRVAE